MTALISSRRSFITGLVSFVAAPAIVRVASIMPVKVMQPTSEQILEHLMRSINPPLIMGTGDAIWEINYEYIRGQIIHACHVPEKYMVCQ